VAIPGTSDASDAVSDLASAKKTQRLSRTAGWPPERRRCFVRCRERSVATGGGGAYGWARRHARGLGAIVEGATRTFQGHRVGELMLGALLEDLRGGRDGQSRSGIGASRECDDHRRALDSRSRTSRARRPRRSLSREDTYPRSRRRRATPHDSARRVAGSVPRGGSALLVLLPHARAAESDRENGARRIGFRGSVRVPA
jgi:hypothetical protein